MAELGIVAAPRRQGLGELLTIVADTEDTRLPPLARELLQLLAEQLRMLDDKIHDLDQRLVRMARTETTARQLAAVPGIGPVVATALAATVADAQLFQSGRHFAAWLGLVPRQHATGGKARLLGISKRGDGYLRRQLINGARAVVRAAKAHQDGLWGWINGLLTRRPFNVVVVAVANKLARIAWALLARHESWRPAQFATA